MISLHGGGSSAAMKQEIWRNYPVGNKVELVERLLERGGRRRLARQRTARHATGSRASAALRPTSSDGGSARVFEESLKGA